MDFRNPLFHSPWVHIPCKIEEYNGIPLAVDWMGYFRYFKRNDHHNIQSYLIISQNKTTSEQLKRNEG